MAQDRNDASRKGGQAAVQDRQPTGGTSTGGTSWNAAENKGGTQQQFNQQGAASQQTGATQQRGAPQQGGNGRENAQAPKQGRKNT